MTTPKLVRDLMTVGVQTCPPNTPIRDLAYAMLEHGWEEVVVLEDGNAIGVVGQADLVQAYTRPENEACAAVDIMREDVPTIPADIPLTAAAQLMLDMGVRTFFLTHRASGIEYPAAVISFRHILRHLASDDGEDLRDLGIYADREPPLQAFIQRRDASRKAAEEPGEPKNITRS